MAAYCFNVSNCDCNWVKNGEDEDEDEEDEDEEDEDEEEEMAAMALFNRRISVYTASFIASE